MRLAAAAVLRSFELEALPKQYAAFHFDGESIDDLRLYRRWLIDRIARDSNVPIETAEKLRTLASAAEAKQAAEEKAEAEREAAEKLERQRAKNKAR